MKKGRSEVLVGMFVIIGFILLTITVFFVSGAYIFRPGYHINVMYEYVSILDKGAPVRMAGVRVGEVSNVELLFDEKEGVTRVKLRLFIEKGVEIRENYTFFIRGTHILSEPHIEINPVPGNALVIQPDAVIQGSDPIALESLIQKAHDIAASIDQILASFNKAVGDEESQQALKRVLLNMAALTDSFNKIMTGSEDSIKDSITQIQSSSESLGIILEKISKGEGTAGKLLMEDEVYDELNAFVKEIRAKPWRLLKKDGGGKFLGLF